MRNSRLASRALRACLAFLAVVLAAVPAAAAITTSPSTATIAPGDATPVVTLNASIAPGPSVANAVFSGLPPGASVTPNPVVLVFSIVTGLASAPFQIVTANATPPGIYPISITTLPDYGAGTGIFTLVVGNPDFQTIVVPNPVSIAWGATANVRVTTTTQFGFNAPISYAFSGFPSGITTSGPQTASSPYTPLDFQFAVAPRTPPGAHTGTLTASWVDLGTQTRSIPVSVIVQPPTLAVAFSPPALTVASGGTAGDSAIVLTPGSGYTGTPSLTWGPVPGGIEITPLTLPSPALPPSQTVPVTIRAASAAPGTYTLTARAIDAGAAVDATATLVLTVAPPPDASIAVTPPALVVTAGRSGAVTVTATGVNGFNGTLDVAAPVMPGVAFVPPSFTLRGGESRQVSVQPSLSATPGSAVGTFTATSSSLTGARTATLSLTVAPPPPELTSVSPPALTAGSSGVSLRLTGLHFRTGATVTFTPPGPVVVTTTIASSTLATVVVDTPAATPVGQYRVDLRNPDGAATAAGIPVLVAPPSSLGAPLSVPTAAIVFPRPYAAVTTAEPVFARAVLATTGVGTIVGTWRFDGAPFDQFVVAASGGYPVEVVAKMPLPVATSGEHRLELVVEQPQQLATEPVPVIVSIESNSRLRILDPEAGATIVAADAEFRWTLVPGASGYIVELERSAEAWPLSVRISDSHWIPDARILAAMGPGKHRVRVSAVFPGEVRGRATEWREFVIPPERAGAGMASGERSAGTNTIRLLSLSGETQAEAPPPADTTLAADAPAALPNDWAVTLLGTVTATDEDVPSTPDTARLQFTTAGDVEAASHFTKWTADLGGSKAIDPDYVKQAETEAWQVEAGARQKSYAEELRVGYSPPSFLDQSEFLAPGLARGGALGRVATPLGSISLYDTYHDEAAGAVSAYDLDQRITGAAWEAPGDPNRSLFRIVGLRSRADGSSESPATEAEALGLFWKYAPSAAFNLVLEGARGTLDGVVQTNGEEYDGYGFHAGASGTRGTFSWSANFRDVDADLVNPANLGLSVGGVPDRTGGDITLGKAIGSSMLSLQLRTQTSGSLADGSGNDIDEQNGTLLLMIPFTPAFVMSATASGTATSGEADADAGLPETDRTMVTAGLTFSETLGALSLAESFNWQEVSDEVTSAFDSTVTAGSFTIGGMVGSSVLLSALVSATRSESPEPVGTTDLWLASLQPTFNWGAAALALTPRASWTRVESELGGTTDNEQYALVVQWSPPWMESFFNVQVGADWNRTTVEGMPSTDFDQRIVGSLTLRWGLSRAVLSAEPPAPLPQAPVASARSARTGDISAR